jgi:vacuolar-type H+-ATPase subunit F/Vma7
MDLTVIADEWTALGWRLAGARVLIPDLQTVAVCFGTALRDSQMVLITAELASAVPARQLEEALRATPPLVLVITDLREDREPPDMEDETRRALGVVP